MSLLPATNSDECPDPICEVDDGGCGKHASECTCSDEDWFNRERFPDESDEIVE